MDGVPPGASRAARFFCLLFIGIIVAGCAQATIAARSAKSAAALAGAGGEIPAMEGYPIGESLDYEIAWWGIPVGLVTMTVSNEKTDPTLKGLVKLICVGRSNKYLEAFYPVRVQLTSAVDPHAKSPRRFEASIQRRRRIHESVITFDPSRMTAFHQLPKGKDAIVPFTPATQDGMSLLYYSRLQPFRIGQKVPLEVAADGKNWPLTGHILAFDTVELRNIGRWRAFQGEIRLTYPVPFFKGAKAYVWFSADQDRVPLLAKIHSRIGPVTVVLIKRRPGRSS